MVKSSTKALAQAGEAKTEGQPLERTKRPPLVRLKVLKTENGVGTVQVDFTEDNKNIIEESFQQQLGTDNDTFATAITTALSIMSLKNGGTEISQTVLNSHLSVVRGIGPRDEVEAMLACQMAAIHTATMNMAGDLSQSHNGKAREFYMNQLNKLARTFTTQVEALKRYRSKGDQRVVVEHVHVHAGGQAVVGNFNQENRSSGDGGDRDGMHLPERAAVLGAIEANEVPMQGAGSDGLERLSVSRGKGRATIRAVK